MDIRLFFVYFVFFFNVRFSLKVCVCLHVFLLPYSPTAHPTPPPTSAWCCWVGSSDQASKCNLTWWWWRWIQRGIRMPLPHIWGSSGLLRHTVPMHVFFFRSSSSRAVKERKNILVMTVWLLRTIRFPCSLPARESEGCFLPHARNHAPGAWGSNVVNHTELQNIFCKLWCHMLEDAAATESHQLFVYTNTSSPRL